MKTSRPRGRSSVGDVASVPLRIPIEELARRTGVTVRNLRELTTRGLLQAPVLEGRKGFYTDAHVARVALVRRLQDRGYSLTAIADLLARWQAGGSVAEMLEQAVTTPASGKQEALAGVEVLRILPELAKSPKLLARARELEFVTGEGEALFAPSAELVHIARTFVDNGVPLAALLSEMGKLRQDAERIAARFRAMFQESVMNALQQKNLPTEQMAELSERIRLLRPAGVRATTILLSQAIERGGPVRSPGRKRSKK